MTALRAVQTELGMLSTAKLDAVGSIVLVGPPLSASGLSNVPVTPVWSPSASGAERPQPLPVALAVVVSVGSVLML